MTLTLGDQRYQLVRQLATYTERETYRDGKVFRLEFHRDDFSRLISRARLGEANVVAELRNTEGRVFYISIKRDAKIVFGDIRHYTSRKVALTSCYFDATDDYTLSVGRALKLQAILK